MWKKRNYQANRYVAWRKRVKARDGWKCRWPGCNYKGKHLECHHIKTWAKNPLLRFVAGNGVTLCKKHHKMVKGKEKLYEPLLIRIIHGMF